MSIQTECGLHSIFDHLLRLVRKITHIQRCSVKSAIYCKEFIIKEQIEERIQLLPKRYVIYSQSELSIQSFVHSENKKCNYKIRCLVGIVELFMLNL